MLVFSMVFARRRFASPGYALMLLGFGHAVWALVAYGEPLHEILRARVVRSVGDGIFDTDHDRGPRAAGFWFLLAAPLVAVDGYLTESALAAGNRRAATISGLTTLGLGLVGTTVIPRSGFPVAIPLGYWLLRRSRALELPGGRLSRAARAAGTA
jgi:hypothetical protein